MSALPRYLPTVCRHCGYKNGGQFNRCPLCKRPVAHFGDRLVGYTAAAASIFIAAHIGGFLQ